MICFTFNCYCLLLRSSSVAENCNSGEVIDVFCPDEQYGKKVEDSEDEFLDYFRIVGINSKKPEHEFVKDILETLDSTLKKAKVHEPNDFYRSSQVWKM